MRSARKRYQVAENDQCGEVWTVVRSFVLLRVNSSRAFHMTDTERPNTGSLNSEFGSAECPMIDTPAMSARGLSLGLR